MTYTVKELFYTLQGEGANAGRPAVFCRFAGCNLWSGLEKDRSGAECTFCDTDFVGTDGPGGGKFATAEDLSRAAFSLWPDQAGNRFIVFTGGEPMLQLDAPLIAAMHAAGFTVAVESNGTLAPVSGIDWLCISPKADTALKATSGDELKLVYPQEKAMPERFEGLDFTHFFLQPMDGPEREANTQAAIEYCKAHPKWRLSIQTHKMLGIP